MTRFLSISTLTFAALLAALPGLAADPATGGRLDLDVGQLDHPLGLATDEPATYALGRLQYELTLAGEAGRIEVTYDGSLTSFDHTAPLGYRRHALGLEYVSTAPRRTDTVWSVGLQGALRRQDDYYTIYDHDEWQGYVALKGYASPRVMLRGHAGVRTRTYAALPEESYVEPYGQLEARYFSPSRTTVGGVLRLGGKWYHDPVSRRVWDTPDTPVTSQLAASLNVSQSVSERVGLRAAVEHRRSLADFPYYVSDEIYDNPLLDRYASAGWLAAGSVKFLAPRQIWLRLGVFWRDDDYGEIRFYDVDGQGHRRQDTTTSLWLSLERTLGFGGRRLVLTGHAGWTDQASSLATYTWSGPTAGAGVSWRW